MKQHGITHFLRILTRELPGTFSGRLLFIWFTPGPATGLVFAVTNLIVVLVVMYDLYERLLRLPDAGYIGIDPKTIRGTLVLFVAYLCVGLAGVRFIIAALRLRNTVRVGVRVRR